MATNEASNTTVASGHPIRKRKSKTWVFGWPLVALGAITWILPSNFPEQGYPLKQCGFFAALAISVGVHEIAHFVAAWLLGLKPWYLRFGDGATIFHKQFKSFWLILKSLPYTGAVYPYVRTSRSRMTLMVLAGPLSNLAMLIAFHEPYMRMADLADNSFRMQMLLANICLVLGTLIPFYYKRVPNDGMMLVHRFREKPGKIKREEAPLKSLFPQSTPWISIVNQLPPNIAVLEYRILLSDPGLSVEQRCEVLDSFVTWIVMGGISGFLPEADQYSQELIQLKPHEWTIKGTRGSVLIEKEDIEAGATMLKEVMANSESIADRSISASFLALAELKQNNLAEARQWIQISRELDPNCASMLRIEALVKKAAK